MSAIAHPREAHKVGNQTLPAGSYKFESLLNSIPGKDAIDVLVVRSAEGRHYQAMVTGVIGSPEPNNGRLVFTRTADHVFLAEVWEPWEKSGLPASERKRPGANRRARKRAGDLDRIRRATLEHPWRCERNRWQRCRCNP